jgi:catechol 2,3-dioxygenase-like lactoylglutathione lyase family enzyme
MAVSPVRLNHAVLFVADLNRAVRFYTEVFGMELITREPGLNGAFLRLPRSGNHHDLGLFGIAGAVPQPRRSVGLYHLAWQLDTVDELVEFRRTLLDAGAYTGESSHGAKSVYGADPTATSSRSCGCSRGRSGASTKVAVVERLDLAAEFDTWSGTRRPATSARRSPATLLDQPR